MTTGERLEKLEQELSIAKRRNRWYLAVTALAVVGVGGAWVALAGIWTKASPTVQTQDTGAVTKVVRANEFILVDKNGKGRALLNMHEDGPMLRMLDENGEVRAGLTVGKNLTGLVLTGVKGTCAGMFVAKETPGLSLRDDKGKIRAEMTVEKEGSRLHLFEGNGCERASLGVSQIKMSDGKTISYPESSLLLFGPDGKVIWSEPLQ